MKEDGLCELKKNDEETKKLGICFKIPSFPDL